MSYELLKANIERLLEEKNWSKYYLGKKIDNPTGLDNIMRGRSKNPSLKILKSIAEAFDLEVQDLLSSYNIHKVETEAPFNLDLMQDTCIKVTEELKKITNHEHINSKNILEIIRNVYEYSLQLKLNKVDENFVKWEIKKFLK